MPKRTGPWVCILTAWGLPWLPGLLHLSGPQFFCPVKTAFLLVLRLNQGKSEGSLCKTPEVVPLPSPVLGDLGQGGQEADVYLELPACWELPEDSPVVCSQAQQPRLQPEPVGLAQKYMPSPQGPSRS